MMMKYRKDIKKAPADHSTGALAGAQGIEPWTYGFGGLISHLDYH